MTSSDGEDAVNGGSSEESPTPISGPVNAGAIPMRQQPHGGALRTGGSNAGGPGRPTNAFRTRVFESLESRFAIAEQIADGEPMERVKFETRHLAPYVKCAICGASEIIAKETGLGDVEIAIKGSASPKDRLNALVFMAKISVGEVKDVAADEVRDRLDRTLNAIQELVDEPTFNRILTELQPIWTVR